MGLNLKRKFHFNLYISFYGLTDKIVFCGETTEEIEKVYAQVWPKINIEIK